MTIIVSAARTPVGKLGGSLSGIPAFELGARVMRAVVQRAGISPVLVDEAIMGNVLQAGQGQGPARQAALGAGLGIEVPATTINNICGSGLRAIHYAMAMIESGQAEVVVAGGMENMSQAPFLLPGARQGYKLGNATLVDSMLNDALTDAFDGSHMGVTAERLAQQYNITRGEQDAYAISSQEKARRAMQQQRFGDEIIPVEIGGKNGTSTLITEDEHPRPGITLEDIAELKPPFEKNGTVTAANSSGINDGAAAVLLMSERKARELGIDPMVRILANATTGVDPSVMGIGPVSAVQKVLKKAALSLQQIDLVELNEAFAAQALSVMRALKIDEDKVNVNGGAIALGHPVGASGARILVSLLFEMQKRQCEHGLAALCVGGGMGVATLVKGNR